MASAEDENAAFLLVTTVIKAEHIVAVVVLRAAPDAATIFPKYPHEKGRFAVVLEVEGAPPAQPARAGECLPASGQTAFPAEETSTATQEALLQQPSACSQRSPKPVNDSSPMKNHGS